MKGPSMKILAGILLRTSWVAIIAILLSVACTGSGSAQTVIRGTVVESVNGRPIVTADLRVFDDERRVLAIALTDSAGRFRIELPDSGTFDLAIRHLAFASIMAENLTVARNEDLELRVTLDPTAVLLEGVTVVARAPFEPIRLTEFRERAELNQRMGVGRIYMRDDLDRLNINSAGDLLTGLSTANCRPTVLLDGLPAEGFLFGLRAEDLEGIEIYRGVTQIPPEFYRYGMCGLTMLWTRAAHPDSKPLTWARTIAAGVILGVIGFLMF
jgi:hypothetical protein